MRDLCGGRPRYDDHGARSAPRSTREPTSTREGASATRRAPGPGAHSRLEALQVERRQVVVTTPPACELADARREHLVRREPAAATVARRSAPAP